MSPGTNTSLGLLIFGILLMPLTTNDADASTENQFETDVIVLGGYLTTPKDNAPFGGEDIGKYRINANSNAASILIAFEGITASDMVLEGWLVDLDSDYKLSLGQMDNTGHLFFSQTIVNPWIYDVLVITEEPMNDTDPSPHKPVGGILLEEPFGGALHSMMNLENVDAISNILYSINIGKDRYFVHFNVCVGEMPIKNPVVLVESNIDTVQINTEKKIVEDSCQNFEAIINAKHSQQIKISVME